MPQSKTILIVDDSRLFLDYERTVLEPCGCRVQEALSFRDAVAMLKNHPPDLLLLDLNLPDRNGDELCKLIKGTSDFAHVPVIMVSASEQMEDVQRCIDAGCDDYLSKPINADVLRAKVGRALGVAARRAFRVPIQIKIMRKEGGAFFGYTRDVSATGIAVLADEAISPGKRVQIQFRDPQTSHTIACVASVRRSVQQRSSHLLGLAFEDLSAADRELVRKILDARGGGEGS
jgi:CheY-like chemotaxis protein